MSFYFLFISIFLTCIIEQNSIQLQVVRVFETDLPEYDSKVLRSSVNSCFVAIGSPLVYHIFPKQGYFPSKKVVKKH